MLNRFPLRCIVCLLVPQIYAADFDDRFKEIREASSPQELYAFLYATPKGGDLHNHFGGANRSEWIWSVLTDPARNGGEKYYARERFDAAPDAIAATARHHTIRHYTFTQHTPEVRREYIELNELTSTERDNSPRCFSTKSASTAISSPPRSGALNDKSSNTRSMTV